MLGLVFLVFTYFGSDQIRNYCIQFGYFKGTNSSKTRVLVKNTLMNDVLFIRLAIFIGHSTTATIKR